MTPEELLASIVPKSDQLNADSLLGGPITVTIASVKGGDKEQPVVIGIGDRMPYKPCKSMRRVLIAAWGNQGADWVGKSMTLYCDPTVMFGGVAVGGIRISHLSHIDDRSFMLTKTRGKKGEFLVKKLVLPDSAKPLTEEEFTKAESDCKLRIASAKSVDEIAEALRAFPREVALKCQALATSRKNVLNGDAVAYNAELAKYDKAIAELDAFDDDAVAVLKGLISDLPQDLRVALETKLRGKVEHMQEQTA